MKIIADLNEHYDYLDKLLSSNPDEVLISSYGIYAGILHDGRDANLFGPKYKTRSIDTLTKMADFSVKMLVGVTDFNPCKNNCDDCEIKYINGLLRIKNHSDRFPSINFKIMRHNHMKCFIIRKGNKFLGVTGGRNFSDSMWNDISFVLQHDDCVRIVELFNDVYNSAVFITDETISAILNEQGISCG